MCVHEKREGEEYSEEGSLQDRYLINAISAAISTVTLQISNLKR